jgi:hypothetical protein
MVSFVADDRALTGEETERSVADCKRENRRLVAIDP